MNVEIVWLGFISSLLAGLATGLGAIPVLFTERVSDRFLDTALGFAAGVMLATTAFGLIVPSVDLAGPWVAVFGLLIGATTIHLIDRIPYQDISHVALNGWHMPALDPLKAGVWLFFLAIAIHNFPEGLAVGVSFGSGDVAAGFVIALAIGLQNMPEGLAVALPFLRAGDSRSKSFGYATLTGLVEPVGGLLGVALVASFQSILPWALAFAAGAMLFVISDKIIPECQKSPFNREATFGLIAGFALMTLLDGLFV